MSRPRSFVAGGTSNLPEAKPELCLALLHALEGLAAASDQQIYDEVVQHIAPLPVLRHTIRAWRDALTHGEMREAADDVLLVLTPEHLCTRIAGRGPDEDDVVHESFQPDLVCATLRCPAPAPFILTLGCPPERWISQWGIRLLRAMCHWPGAALVHMANRRSLFWGLCGLSASSMGLTAALDTVCCATSPRSRAPRVGVSASPNLLLFVQNSRVGQAGTPQGRNHAHFEPVTSWVSASALSQDGGRALSSCFSLEFNLQ